MKELGKGPSLFIKWRTSPNVEWLRNREYDHAVASSTINNHVTAASIMQPVDLQSYSVWPCDWLHNLEIRLHHYTTRRTKTSKSTKDKHPKERKDQLKGYMFNLVSDPKAVIKFKRSAPLYTFRKGAHLVYASFNAPLTTMGPRSTSVTRSSSPKSNTT